eukprot:767228-Hanusia_phi.AAC.2
MNPERHVAFVVEADGRQRRSLGSLHLVQLVERLHLSLEGCELGGRKESPLERRMGEQKATFSRRSSLLVLKPQSRRGP